MFAFIMTGMLLFLSTYTHSAYEQVFLTPTFQDTRGWRIYTFHDGKEKELTPQELLSVEEGKTFYLSRELTADLADTTFLMLDSQRPLSVFLDDALLYTTCPKSSQVMNEVVFPKDYIGVAGRDEAIRCTLPNDFVAKTLTIATTHPSSEYGASLPSVRLSSSAIEAEKWLSTANINSMPAVAFAIMALLLIALLFYNFYQGNKAYSLLLLTITAFVWFFYYLLKYEYSSPGYTLLDTPWAAFLPYLILLLPEYYLAFEMKHYRKQCICLLLLFGGLSLIAPLSNLFGKPMALGYTLCNDALLLSYLVFNVFAYLEMRDKNKVFQLFFQGIITVCIILLLLGLSSFLNDGFYVHYMMSIIRQIATNDLVLFHSWSATILFMLAFFISVYVFVAQTTNTQVALAIEKEHSAMLDIELSLQKQVYEAKLTNEEELRALRHDMKSHLTTLAELIAQGYIDKASEYLESLTLYNREHQSKIFCQNPYMNAVFNTYDQRFSQHEIPFTCHVGIDAQELPHVELCLILTNALENAFEASLKEDKANRYVEVRARVHNQQFLLQISNRFTQPLHIVGQYPLTSKTEGHHGYGMANIHAALQHLQGSMDYRVENGLFILDVTFPLNH